jgi:hypothetical protein
VFVRGRVRVFVVMSVCLHACVRVCVYVCVCACTCVCRGGLEPVRSGSPEPVVPFGRTVPNRLQKNCIIFF